MEFPLLKRLAEIQKKLKPVLNELGLKAKLTSPLLDNRITFTNVDGSVVHSVEIHLGEAATRGQPDPWKGSYMRRTRAEEVPIGDNGWKYLEYGDFADSKPFDENAEETFGYIEECLRHYPVIRQGNSHPDLVVDEEFDEVYREIEWRIRDITNSPITCDRTDGVMSINFAEEYSGDLWRIAFQNYRTALFINGEKLAETASYDTKKVAHMLYDKIRDLHIPDLDTGI
ncbi:hypothetical protein [Ensifer sp. Root127]|uniref:hypothetical protein n=1 Tax=Ensifer sp. Root127 TaxID=1736440 RepID=UPI0007101117|nr:hypothetical protein [Ensifer sp. Root127]KQW82051.1 hypothetical protein ASD03_23320 [Ensifer sp. Root127]